MPFPIFDDCGRILFRDGKPALSLDCCCYLVPCCSDCYFPTESQYTDDFDEDSEIGGPSQITDFYLKQTRVVPSPYVREWFQNGVSTHHLTARDIGVTDCKSWWKWTSKCEWTIPVLVEEDYGDGTELFVRIRYSSPGSGQPYRWSGLLLFGAGLNPLIPPDTPPCEDTEYLPIGEGECSGTFEFEFCTEFFLFNQGTLSWEFFRWEYEGYITASGGKPWPEGFECQAPYLRRGDRFAFTNELPAGFF